MAEKLTHGFLEEIRSPRISSCIYGQFFLLAFNSPTSVTTPVTDFFFSFLTIQWGMQDLNFPKIKPMPLQWKYRVLTTGPPEKPYVVK